MPDARGVLFRGLKAIGLLLCVALGLVSIIGSGDGFNNDSNNPSPSIILSEQFALMDAGCTYEYFQDIEENCLTYVANDQLKTATEYQLVTHIRNPKHNTLSQSFQFSDASGDVVGAGTVDIDWQEPEEDESFIMGPVDMTGMLGEYMVDTWLIEADGGRSYLFTYEITVSN